ncbi:DUF378 domain-containing protein [Patescibacteria group bacterium]
MKSIKLFHMVAFIFVCIGGLNWGLIGSFDINLLTLLFGEAPQIEKLLYILIGISAVYLFATHSNDCKTCK